MQRAEAKRAAALDEAGREETPAAQARRNRLRVRLAQLHDTLAAAEQELGRPGRGAT